MDLASIKPTTTTVEITHPGTGAMLGVRFTVMSIEDDRLKRVKRDISDERLKLDQKNKALKTEDIENNGRKLLFAATTGWEWYNPSGNEGDDGFDASAMPTFEGEVPDFNLRNFNRVVTALPWIADQLREAVDETKAFFVN